MKQTLPIIIVDYNNQPFSDSSALNEFNLRTAGQHPARRIPNCGFIFFVRVVVSMFPFLLHTVRLRII